MNRCLADEIERYLKEMLAKAKGSIEVQRSMLAQLFTCVPSQINYVLETRFTPVQGYFVESRRGGKGYVRIVKILSFKTDSLQYLLEKLEENPLSPQEAEGLLGYLQEEGFLTRREMLLLKAVIEQATCLVSMLSEKELRARIMKAVLLTLTRPDFSKEGE